MCSRSSRRFVHVLNKFRYEQEGQLSSLHQDSAGNGYLNYDRLTLGLVQFVGVDTSNHRTRRRNIEKTMIDLKLITPHDGLGIDRSIDRLTGLVAKWSGHV